MAFRFGFSFRKSKSGENHIEPGQEVRKNSASLVRPVAREVLLSEKTEEKIAETETVNLQGGLSLLKGRVSTSDLLGISQCDIVLGKYEGGFKLWECAVDLIEVLRREIEDGRLSFRGKHVLELGCGHGLPGIFACLKGAARVHFQDYNAEVLTNLTMPNVEANIAAHAEHLARQLPRQSQNGSSSSEGLASHRPPVSSCDIHYYAGDWADMDALLSLPSDLSITNSINTTTTTNNNNNNDANAAAAAPLALLSSPSASGSSATAESMLASLHKDQEPAALDNILAATSAGPTLTGAAAAADGALPAADGAATSVPSLARSRSHSRSFSRVNEVAQAASAAELATAGGYDVILMSETVYSPASLPLLLHLIKRCLRSPYGVVYVAGKKLYFGVGGGTRQFKSVVDEDGALSGHLVTDIVDGSSNIREIWKFFYRSRRGSTLESHDPNSAASL